MYVYLVGVPLLYLCLTVPLGFVLRGEDGQPQYGYNEAYVCFANHVVQSDDPSVLFIYNIIL